MKLTIKNGNWRQRKHTKTMINYAVNELMAEFDDELDVTVDIIDAEKFNGDLRYTAPDKEAYDAWKADPLVSKPRIFTIRMNGNRSLRFFLQTFAHELIHLEQFVTGRIKTDQDETQYFWNDELIWNESMEPLFHVDDKGFFKMLECDRSQPWEVEARGLEYGMLIDWCLHTLDEDMIAMFHSPKGH